MPTGREGCFGTASGTPVVPGQDVGGRTRLGVAVDARAHAEADWTRNARRGCLDAAMERDVARSAQGNPRTVAAAAMSV